MRILVVEDESRMANLLRQGLSEEGHSVTIASDGREGLVIARTGSFDLILLDVMLPRINGISVTRELRARHNLTPILILTARDCTKDVIDGLDAGADDYLTKPFSFDELFARIRAVVRRGPIPRNVCLRVSDLSLNQSTHEVKRGGRPLHLTRTEFSLLELLMRHAGQVIERNRLIEGVWGVGTEIENNTLDAFMRLLRSKIELPGESRLIRTVRGVGYVVNAGER